MHRFLVVYKIDIFWKLFLISSIITPSFAQTPTSFDCSTGLGYILTNVSQAVVGNVTSFYSFNLSNGSSTLIKDGILAGPANRFLNGFGYNVKDNFLYGYHYNTNEITRLGSNGAVQSFSVVGLSTSGEFAAGDVSPDGILYLYGTGTRSIVAIDLNSSPFVAQTRLTLPANHFFTTGLNDWTFSPIDGNIYGMTTGKVLFKYDLSTNTITTLGTVGGLDSQSGSFGTAFMDSQGNLYVGNNTSGAIYRIATPNSPVSPLVATLFSTSLAGKSPGDGARCPNQIVAPSANTDQVCLASGTTPVSITVAVNDGAGTYPLNPASVRLIDPVTSSAVTSVTTSQGTYSVNTTTGVVMFSAAAGFSGSSVQYTIADNQGDLSGKATLSILPALNAPTIRTVNATCSTPGSLTIIAPVSASLTYSITGTSYQASPIFASVAPGTYSVTVRYTGGACVSSPTSASFNAPIPPTLGPITGSTTLCNSPASSTYTYTTPGGVWSVTPASLAMINASTGVLTTVANASGTATLTYTVTTGNSCSSTTSLSLTIASTYCPLPIALVNFRVQAQADHMVLLNWATAWEQANQQFDIQRSKDMKLFETVGVVKDVAGTSDSFSTYRFIDANPYSGTSYYRLIQLDTDGTRHTYQAEAVVVERIYGVFPNPVTATTFTVYLDEPATAILHLYTSGGSEVGLHTASPAESSVKLTPLYSLAPGIYILTVEERAQRRTHRLLIP